MAVLPEAPRAVWLASLAGAWNRMDEKNLSLIAAGMAFYSLLSLFPAITALVSIWGIFANPVAIQDQMTVLEDVAPQAAYDIIAGQVQALVAAPPSALTWAGALAVALALWSARAGVGALMRGLNAVYDEHNHAGLRQIAKELALTVMLVALAAVFALLLIVVPVVLTFVPLGPLANVLLRLAQWAVLVVMVMATLGLVYRLAPNRRPARMAWLSPGAMLAAAVWTLASLAFTLYLERFASYNEVYGSLGAVIAMLMWFFLSAHVVLLGASVNAELERRTLEDSTIGRDRPIGERGAVVADTYLPVK